MVIKDMEGKLRKKGSSRLLVEIYSKYSQHLINLLKICVLTEEMGCF
jgi:hypothetical protein